MSRRMRERREQRREADEWEEARKRAMKGWLEWERKENEQKRLEEKIRREEELKREQEIMKLVEEKRSGQERSMRNSYDLWEESDSDEMGGDITICNDAWSDSDCSWEDEGVSKVERSREYGGVSSRVS